MVRNAAPSTGRVRPYGGSAPHGFVAADGAVGSLRGDRPRLFDDAPRLVFLAFALFLALEASLERVDALAKIAHDSRQLPAAAEDQYGDCQEDQKMPNAQ